MFTEHLLCPKHSSDCLRRELSPPFHFPREGRHQENDLYFFLGNYEKREEACYSQAWFLISMTDWLGLFYKRDCARDVSEKMYGRSIMYPLLVWLKWHTLFRSEEEGMLRASSFPLRTQLRVEDTFSISLARTKSHGHTCLQGGWNRHISITL